MGISKKQGAPKTCSTESQKGPPIVGTLLHLYSKIWEPTAKESSFRKTKETGAESSVMGWIAAPPHTALVGPKGPPRSPESSPRSSRVRGRGAPTLEDRNPAFDNRNHGRCIKSCRAFSIRNVNFMIRAMLALFMASSRYMWSNRIKPYLLLAGDLSILVKPAAHARRESTAGMVASIIASVVGFACELSAKLPV